VHSSNVYWMLKDGWSSTEWLRQHDRSPSSEVRRGNAWASWRSEIAPRPGNANGPPPSNHAPVSSDVEAREDDFGRSCRRRKASLRRVRRPLGSRHSLIIDWRSSLLCHSVLTFRGALHLPRALWWRRLRRRIF
jgi:hypothetical protein